MSRVALLADPILYIRIFSLWFMKIKPLRNGEITDVGKSFDSRDFLTSQICLLTLFARKNLAKISKFTVLLVPFGVLN